MTCTVEQYDNRGDWLQARQSGIGASDAAAVVGLSSYSSPYSLWAAKTSPVEDSEMEPMQRWGLILEPIILEEFSLQSGVECIRDPDYEICRSDKRQHVFCTLDAHAKGVRPYVPVQLKTAHFEAGKVWKKRVPLAYMVQVQQEMYVTGADRAYIAVLIDGYDFRWHRVNRHQVFIDKLMKRIDHFWSEYVLKRQAPPADYSQATTRAMLAMYPRDNGDVVDLPGELDSLGPEFDALQKQKKDIERQQDAIRNRVREAIGGNRYGAHIDGSGWEWKGDGSRTLRRKRKVPHPV